MNKILFFDIDGTLVSFLTHRVPDSTVEAIREARNAGCRVFISTGRPFGLINNLDPLQQANLIDGYITANGGYCFMGDTTISSRRVSPVEVENMVRLCREDGMSCIFSDAFSVGVCNPGAELERIFYHDLAVNPIREVRAEDIPLDEIYQMTAFYPEASDDRMHRLLPDCEINRWHPDFSDITARGADKAEGVRNVCRYLGMSLEDAIAFGDGGNDIPMLRIAGTGVAMGNAAKSVQESADYVTQSVDADGIMNALRHIGII